MPGNLRDLLREDVFGVVVDGGDRQHVGVHRQNQDGRIGGVDLAIGRRRRQVLRQLAAGGVDPGLHVLRGRIDVAVQVELQRDLRWCRARWSRSSATARRSPRTDTPAASPPTTPWSPGLAPGNCAVTWMVGKSTCGSGATGSSGKTTRPTRKMPPISSEVAIGRRTKGSEMLMRLLGAGLGGGAWRPRH